MKRCGFGLSNGLLFLLFAMPLVVVSAEVVATDVTAKQRYPWKGLVDITVTLQASAEYADVAQYVFVATNSATKMEIPVVHITRNGTHVGSGNTWRRKFIWDIKTDAGAVKIDDVALTVEASIGVQLWEKGPYWAVCNVGASKPEAYGCYFWWGDTVGYKCGDSGWNWGAVDGSKTGFSFESGNCPTWGKNNSQLQSAGYIDSTGNLVAKHDAATFHCGASWRMPTGAEFSELGNKCTKVWTTHNGVYGLLVTGKGAYVTKSIFLPAAGEGYDSHLISLGTSGSYWASTPLSDNSYDAQDLAFWSGYFIRGGTNRYYGCPVRPVRGFVQQ